MKEAEESGISVNRRCLIFIAALALRQNHPHITLEYLAKARDVSHIAIRNMRVSVSIDGNWDNKIPFKSKNVWLTNKSRN